MGANEDDLRAIQSAPEWDAPGLLPLETALSPITRALGDLSQLDPDKWSGAAAEQSAKNFAKLRTRYRALEVAIHDVREAVKAANAARARATEALGDLPSNKAPQAVHTAVDVAKAAGNVNVIIGGVSVLADKAVSIYEGWLGENREEEAREALLVLSEELRHEHKRLLKGKKAIAEAADYLSLDDDEGDDSGGTEWPEPTPIERGEIRPKNPIPDPRSGAEPDVRLENPPPRGSNPNPGIPHLPGDPTPPSPYPDGGWEPTPSNPTNPYPTPSPSNPGPGDSSNPNWPGRGPDVDSGSGGTIGNPGLTAGALGGGALAGGAALRWGSRAGGAGAQGFGAGSAGGASGAGGTGGLLGTGGPGSAGAAGTRAGGPGGIAGGRGLAGGLPGGGAGGGGTTASAGAGSGTGTGAGARGGMVGGGAPGGGMGGSGKKGQKSGLGGHIAPKFEDDDDFIPQSDSARAGSRDPQE